MVILTDCDLFEQLCPGQIGMLTHRFVTIWRSLYHAEILADLISAEHRGETGDVRSDAGQEG